MSREEKARFWSGGNSSHGNSVSITLNEDGSGILSAREHRQAVRIRLSAADIKRLRSLGKEVTA